MKTSWLSRSIRWLVTAVVVILAALVIWHLYTYYTYAPQTRDGKVVADVVPLAADVSGRVDQVLVHDNQVVNKGDLLFVVDKARLQNALDQANAALESAEANYESAQREFNRYQQLSNSAASQQEKDDRRYLAAQDRARVDAAKASRDLAQINLERAEVRSPVDGVITNFSLRPGAYATAGQPVMAIVDRHSYYVVGYFEETKLPYIHDGAPVTVRIMGESKLIEGHVEGRSAGIADRQRSTAPGSLLANVTPTFSWIRLAQRIPVRIALDHVPDHVALIAGRTATVSLKGAENVLGFRSFVDDSNN
ncbi:efflux RND transporter periplasmic adaptor subunit [Pokkaliibacter sp. CJK22405]|uniref:efflux RND transporter periplasmic adaptor subunit n=1 Tax=Pokkaliibacter sp. CJK22405 TaxID=3384615 RepID=UPI00398477A4